MNEESSSHTFKFAAALWALGVLAYFLLSSQPLSIAFLLARRIIQAGAAVVIVGGAAALGCRILRKFLPETEGFERVVCGAGLGVGVLSLTVLVLAHVTTGVLMMIFVVCGILLAVLKKELVFSSVLPADGFSRTILLLMLIMFLLNLSACTLPPLDYDVLEYHLGAPSEYLRNGRMGFLPHNLYASLPGNVEMLYLLAVGIVRSPYDAAVIAKVMNLLLVVLSAAAVFLIGRRVVGHTAGLVAAAALFAHPIVVDVSGKAYVESGLILYTILASYGAVRFAQSGSMRWAAMAGVFAGLGVGCKYTAVPFAAAPVLFMIAFAGRKRPDIRSAAVAAALCTAAFLPWAVRNIVNTGNPVYPLLWNVLGGEPWNAELNARFVAAHTPLWESARPGMGVRVLFQRLFLFFTDMRSGSPVVLAFVPVAFLMKAKKSVVAVAACHFLFCFLVWFAATHRIDRFLAAAVPSLCLLAGAGVQAADIKLPRIKWAVVVCLVAACLALSTTHLTAGSFSVAFGIEHAREWLYSVTEEHKTTYSPKAVSYINGLSSESKTLLVGEAQIYYFTGNIMYTVVFNDNIIEELISGQDVVSRLRKEGITHVFFNWSEVSRLRGDPTRRSYSYFHAGHMRPGYLPNMSGEAILDVPKQLVFERGWGECPPGVEHSSWELYRVRRPA